MMNTLQTTFRKEQRCTTCGNTFRTSKELHEFLMRASPEFDGVKHAIPEPEICAECSHRQKLAFRNERSLHKRKCDMCGNQTVSIFSTDSPYTVYCAGCWWSDKWNPLDYGKPIDWDRPFFEQFEEILIKTPLLANMTWNSVNCDYNNFCLHSKNCYLSSRLGNSEDILFSCRALHSKDCIDCLNIIECQLCYECVDCWNCYGTFFSQLCRNMSESWFCYDCIGCQHCFGSVGLRNAQYCFFNEQLTKEQYETKIARFLSGSRKKLEEAWQLQKAVLMAFPRRSLYTKNAENSTGDFIVESRNIRDSYDVEKSDTVDESWQIEYSKNAYRSEYIYYGENCYENIANGKSTNILFSSVTIDGVHDALYSMFCCNNSGNILGCVSLRQNQYCILNRQYSPDEFMKEASRLLHHMKKTGEYGKFFPAAMSPFSYNQTVAQEFFPATREEATVDNFKWVDAPKISTLKGSVDEKVKSVPENITVVPESMTKEIFNCLRCGGQFRFVPEELVFYRKLLLPLPDSCPDCRYDARRAKRNPKKIWERTCGRCRGPIQTSYSPQREETIACDECYKKRVYL